MTAENEVPPPFQQVRRADLSGAAVLFQRYAEAIDKPGSAPPLPLAPIDAARVAIVVDGVGSSSARLHCSGVVAALASAGFAVTVFSYSELSVEFYDPRDVVRANLDSAVERLDEYIGRYLGSECLLLIGYSFGGFVIAEWLFRQSAHLRDLPGLKGVILVASPVRLNAGQIWFGQEPDRYSGAREHIVRMLSRYTADGRDLPLLTSLAVFRCEVDGLLDEWVYSFSDLPPTERPYEWALPYPHQSIIRAPELFARLTEVADAFCAGHRLTTASA